MSGLLFELDELSAQPRVRIVVAGVGGAGGNAVDRMIRAGVTGVEFAVVNSDAQALGQNVAPARVQIGKTLTRGLGTGARPELGRAAVAEDADELRSLFEGAHLVFVTAGMGGGTGTGAAPEVARIAREAGALTVGVVTRPFHFEMRPRMRRAEEGIALMRETVDTLIVVSNQRLMSIVDQHLSLKDAFCVADEVLVSAVRGISDLITIPGLMNLDFADVREVMNEPGEALMGVGMAELGEGTYGAHLAAEQAISSPLLDEYSVKGARRLLVNITGGESMSLMDVNDAMQTISEAVGEDAEIFLGAVTDPTMVDRICVTVIATGIESQSRRLDEPLQLATRSMPGAYNPQESPRAEVRPVMARPEPVRVEPTRIEPQREYQRPETLRAETHRSETIRSESLRSETPRPESANRGGGPLLITWEQNEAERLPVKPKPAAGFLQDEEPAARQVSFRPTGRDASGENLELPTFLRRSMD